MPPNCPPGGGAVGGGAVATGGAVEGPVAPVAADEGIMTAGGTRRLRCSDGYERDAGDGNC